MEKRKVGGRREPPGGRPPKNNKRLVCYVQPHTREFIDNEAERTGDTLGQVIDQLVLRVGALSSELAWTKKSGDKGSGL
jgi:hypothetical protein